jgi:hypothetical protein
MSQTMHRTTLLVVVMAVAWLSSRPAGQFVQPSTKNGEWPHYTGDARGTKYSPLDQINAGNFDSLEIAWRFKTDNFGTRPRVQARGDAADGRRRALRHGRHTPVGHRDQRRERRASVGAQLS